MSALQNVQRDLADYLNAVASVKNQGKDELARAVIALEAHSRNPDPSLPGPLRHYLESRSYRKAWEWLQGQTPAKGSCGN
ncbi:MAG: hypothetical protein SFU85_08420 [Candidatus Methylacidiphilales bacterium]|nr:hypothetical protein [Candidatus Methylacidiphilales bacterium]